MAKFQDVVIWFYKYDNKSFVYNLFKKNLYLKEKINKNAV